MKLYFAPGACSLCPHIIINELGLDCEFEEVDLNNKTTETGHDFMQVNAKGEVPVLELDNGDLLTENVVILQYLCDSNKATNLLPSIDDFERYRVLERVGFVTTDIHKGMGILFHPDLTDEVKKDILIPNVMNKFSVIEQQLGDSNYLYDDRFTIADPYLFAMSNWALNVFKLDMSAFPNVNRHFNELAKRESVNKSLTEEKLI